MTKKLLLGYDIGSSSIKASLINSENGELVITASSPDTEMKIDSPKEGWAEQHPELWWKHVVITTKKMLGELSQEQFEIAGIGISYQMHGLVMVDKEHEVIYPSIIWCDSRAVEIGNKAFTEIGASNCLGNCLNSPGNFTASKLKWVRENLPEVYKKIYKIMLPGDYIAMKFTNLISTTISGLSEGIFWDFEKVDLYERLLNYYEINKDLIPDLVPNLGYQGSVSTKAANELGIKSGIPVAYRAGDQPNNAFSLNVLNSGEVAATAGTSGVIYGVADKNIYDPGSRVNTFAHVNYSQEIHNVGVLLCINGTGIQYSWLKQNMFDNKYDYNQLNSFASEVEIGANGLMCFPFGNGAERVLENRDIHAQFSGLNFNMHNKRHVIRAAQEGIAFAFKYGFDVMKSIGMKFNVIRAGNSNLFLSRIFRDAFVNTCNVNLEIYNTDGSQGAARAAGIGVGIYSWSNAFNGLKVIEKIEPNEDYRNKYSLCYDRWKIYLEQILNVNN